MPEFEVVVVYSGVTKALMGTTDYNNRVDECRVAGWIIQDLANEEVSSLQDIQLRDISVENYHKYREQVTGKFRRRLDHYFTEQERVHKGIEAWQNGDIDSFGNLMFESGTSSVYQYESGSHTTTNDNRLGAIADIQYVIENVGIDEDLLVLAGDNLFDFELVDFVEFYESVGADCITTHQLDDIEEIKRTDVMEVDEDQILTSFEEKPEHPKSNLTVPPFYIYRREMSIADRLSQAVRSFEPLFADNRASECE